MNAARTPRIALLLTLLGPLCGAYGCRSTAVPAPAPAPAPAPEAAVREGLNDNFLAADLDVDDYVTRFEGESREIAVARMEILDALEITPGMDVGDVGAGTGLFEPLLARAVGPDGRVFAADIAEGFVEHLKQRMADEGIANVEPVLCTERSCEIPEASVDLVFVCDTYHHFTYPRTVLASIHAALRPGGKLVVIDFERIPGVTREWILGHVRAGKDEFRAEIEAAGFTFEEEVDVAGLEENYVLRFTRR